MESKNDESTSKADVPTKAEDKNEAVITQKEPLDKQEEATEEHAATQEEDAVTQADVHPPRHDISLQDVIAMRRCWMSAIASVIPPPPPGLDESAIPEWEYYHQLIVMLNHLRFAFVDDENPRESLWNFYEVWAVANPFDNQDSPFTSFFTADALFSHERDAEKKIDEMWLVRPN